jgi:ribonuclease HII
MKYVIGADEVGYGALAGPLVTCALAVPADWVPPPGLNDSKKLRHRWQREALYTMLHRLPMYLSLVTNDEIDRSGAGKALIAAHTTAIRFVLDYHPDAKVILDGNLRLPQLPHISCIPRADGKFHAVMAASIVAKVNRDRLMLEYAAQYPDYAFEENMGYNSKAHLAGLRRLGRCPIHRRSYRIKAYDLEAKP